MKKCVCGMLAVCLLAMLAVPVFAALPEGSGIVTSSKDISGSEFSSIPAIAAKLDGMFAGNIGLYANKKKTTLVDASLGTRNVPNNGKLQYWGPEPRAGTSCFAYANAFYGYFYDGVYPHQTLNANHQKIKANGKITYNNFVKWGVRNDAVVYIREGNHSFVVLHYDQDYITIADGNGDGKGLIAVRKQPWKRVTGTDIFNQKPSLIVQPTYAYFAAGSLQQGKWHKENGQWCYLDNQGNKVTNCWKKDSVGWCYLGADGYMAVNSWVPDSKGLVYVGADGYMVYDKWIQDQGGWRYAGSDGYLVKNGWKKQNGRWRYLGADGYPVTNTWKKDSKGWCYLGADGYMVVNQWAKDSIDWCYVGSDGYMVVNKWVKDATGWRYVGKNGYPVKNKWQKDSVGWCYLGEGGYMLTDSYAKDSKGLCYLDMNGYWDGKYV